MKKANTQTLSKAFDILSATAGVASDMLKVLTIPSAKTVNGSTVKGDNLKPY